MGDDLNIALDLCCQTLFVALALRGVLGGFTTCVPVRVIHFNYLPY
jgi:hypothetical protein